MPAWQRPDRVGAGSGRGGGALERLQRSKNSANESCVAAPANVAGIALPVTSRVEPPETCELIALRGDCGLDTEPEGAVPFDSCVKDKGCAVDAPAYNFEGQCGAESEGMPV